MQLVYDYLIFSLSLVLCAFLTAVFCMHVFNYDWNWNVAMMFGAVVSATDPVAVVALLKELGQCSDQSQKATRPDLTHDLFHFTPGRFTATVTNFISICMYKYFGRMHDLLTVAAE